MNRTESRLENIEFQSRRKGVNIRLRNLFLISSVNLITAGEPEIRRVAAEGKELNSFWTTNEWQNKRGVQTLLPRQKTKMENLMIYFTDINEKSDNNPTKMLHTHTRTRI